MRVDNKQSRNWVSGNSPSRRINPEPALWIITGLTFIMIFIRRAPVDLIGPSEGEQLPKSFSRSIYQDIAVWITLVIYIACLFALVTGIFFNVDLLAAVSVLAALYILIVIVGNGILIAGRPSPLSRVVFYIIQAGLGSAFGLFVAMLYLL